MLCSLYWKLKYVNHLEFIWDYIRKGQIEIPIFVYDHDDQLEDRPLIDYGVETDPFQFYGMLPLDHLILDTP